MKSLHPTVRLYLLMSCCMFGMVACVMTNRPVSLSSPLPEPGPIQVAAITPAASSVPTALSTASAKVAEPRAVAPSKGAVPKAASKKPYRAHERKVAIKTKQKSTSTAAPQQKYYVVKRYVTARVLNVRSKPSKSAPVTSRMKFGTATKAIVMGEWTKVGRNQYVMTKFLSRSKPKVRARAVAYGR